MRIVVGVVRVQDFRLSLIVTNWDLHSLTITTGNGIVSVALFKQLENELSQRVEHHGWHVSAESLIGVCERIGHGTDGLKTYGKKQNIRPP
jgi:hypothetical protein